jgi:hypothetical protein
MVDIVPVILFVFGLVALGKPEWVAAIDRRQKATGTTRRPDEIEMTDTYYVVIRLFGAAFAFFGLVFILRTW